MSSAATAGPPPHRPPAGSGGGAAGAHRAMNGPSNGNDGAFRASNRVFAHIDDLKAARPDVNIHSPMRTLLSQCEMHAKQSQTHLDFGRPDLALTEYIKATILFVEIIPRHKDFPELKSDRGDQHRLFGALQKGLSARYQKFEEVKTTIKENNAQNGVVPTLKNGNATVPSSGGNALVVTHERSPSGQVKGFTKPNDSHLSDGIHLILNGASAPPSNKPGHEEAPPKRQKPPVQPKPDGLHGKSIKPAAERPAPPALSKTEEDLAARFARLRGPDAHSSGIVQDPRIRTQPIGMPAAVNIDKAAASASSTTSARPNSYQQRPERPSGPRDMPPSGPLKLPKPPLDLNIPSMPRAPDAIYSPARNFDNPTNLDMPRSTRSGTLGGMGRPNSTSSPSSVGLVTRAGMGNLNNTPGFDNRQDYFVRPPSLSNDSMLKAAPRNGLPSSTTVTAEELMEYLKRGSHELSVLLVDIRPREEFDSGHIMCQNIICIEPMVLRKGISAADLADSLVLSPENEERLFKQRETFDLLIYYDDKSTDFRADVTNYGHETALADFAKAVYDYGYEKRLKQRPMLLIGGLDSWVDLLGERALRTSSTGTVPLGIARKTYGQLPSSRRAPAARRPTYESRPLTKEEEHTWEQTIKNESLQHDGISGSPGVLRDSATDEAYFVRTTEDFVRRFPEASAIPESMTSPHRIDDQSAHITAARIDELNSMTPRIPARPPPALPRPSYTGVSDRGPGPTTTVYKSMPTAAQSGIPTAANTITRPVGQSNHCGLHNYGNTCYLNSVIQALSSTMPFATWLLNYDFMSERKPPRKNSETSDPPQLMAKNLANLFRHLWSKKWSHVRPDTLKRYISAVARRSARGASSCGMGGDKQQDANEFLTFLLDILEDETNMARNITMPHMSAKATTALSNMSPLQGSVQEWGKYSSTVRSEISRLFDHQSIATYRCGRAECRHIQRRYEIHKYCFVNLPNNSGSSRLQDCISESYTTEPLDKYICDGCQAESTTTKETKLSVRPEILIIVMNRFQTYNGVKSQHVVTFGEELDMSSHFYNESEPDVHGAAPPNITTANTPPLRYSCFAVIQHLGPTGQSGHYWTLARDQLTRPTSSKSTEWFRFNDDRIEASSFKATQSNQSYILFFQRKHK